MTHEGPPWKRMDMILWQPEKMELLNHLICDAWIERMRLVKMVGKRKNFGVRLIGSKMGSEVSLIKLLCEINQSN